MIRFAAVAAAVPLAAGLAITQSPVAAAKDPCSPSEMSRTLSGVTAKVADYMDAHPDTDEFLTGVLKNPPDDHTADKINNYFDTNPGVRNDLIMIAIPLGMLNEQCKLAERGPALLAVFQNAQAAGKLPSLPGVPGIPGTH